MGFTASAHGPMSLGQWAQDSFRLSLNKQAIWYLPFGWYFSRIVILANWVPAELSPDIRRAFRGLLGFRLRRLPPPQRHCLQSRDVPAGRWPTKQILLAKNGTPTAYFVPMRKEVRHIIMAQTGVEERTNLGAWGLILVDSCMNCNCLSVSVLGWTWTLCRCENPADRM